MAEIRNIRSGSPGEPPRPTAPRRLAAIVAGDIAGYSRLMEIDEEGTHARVMRIERDLIEPSITEHNGKLVKTTGDGFIAIFDSPVEAVKCGIVIQQNMIGRNASQQKHLWIEYRIGVNLGDVIIEPNDVYGDGVNIAARLEGIAEPGQVYISGGIYEQIKHKLVCGYESLGDRKVKNITDPVRVYRVLSDPAAFNMNRKRRENVLILMLGLTLLVIASGILWFVLGQSKQNEQASAPASTASDVPKAPTSPEPVAKQAATQPSTSPAQQPQPPASAPPASKQTAPLPQPTSPVSPAAAPLAPSVSEPEMIAIPGASFAMGSNDDPSEKPVHQVTIRSFSMSKFPITVREWNECAANKACGFVADGREDAPITNVSWSDAKQYVAWLAGASRKAYRLPSEAEWEYAARGGTQTKYWWGDQLQPGMAHCKDCGGAAADQPLKVGSFKPNPFGTLRYGRWCRPMGRRLLAQKLSGCADGRFNMAGWRLHFACP